MTRVHTVEIDHCNGCGSDGWREVARAIDFESHTCENEFRYAECTACGLVYLRNRPDPSELSVIYPPDYRPHQFNQVLGSLIGGLRDRFQQRSKISALARYAGRDAFVIDVGCGSAELLRLMRDHGDPSWRLAGVDFAESAARAVEALGLQAYRARFEAMEWTDAAPDVVLMSHVIEHLDDPRAVAEKAFSLLAPGGHFVVETPSLEGWDARWFRRRYWGGWHCPRHWTLYDHSTLRGLLEGCGFEVVEESYLLSPNFWLQSLHHYTEERLRAPRLARVFDTKHLVPLVLLAGFDLFQKLVRGRTSNLRMVGCKPALVPS